MKNPGCNKCKYFSKKEKVFGDCLHESNKTIDSRYDKDIHELISRPMKINKDRDCKNFEYKTLWKIINRCTK